MKDKMKDKILIDSGFDTDFDINQINEINKIFDYENLLKEYINTLHIESSAYDLKRGEYYPEILRATKTLKAIVASKYNIHPSQVHPNFGSNGSIDTILTSLLSASVSKIKDILLQNNDEKIKLEEIQLLLDSTQALVVTPTYFRNYNSTESKNIKLEKISTTSKDFEFDVSIMMNTIKKSDSQVVMIVTPNNPTGVALKENELYQMLDALKDNQWCMIDRTLVDIDNNIDTKELLEKYKHKNIVILHSFSKFNSLSHVRIGVALYSNEDFANKIKPNLPLGSNFEGLIKASKLVYENGYIQADKEIINNIQKNKIYLYDFFYNYDNIHITDFVSNYALVYWDNEKLNSTDLVSFMQEKSLYVMDGSEFPEPNSNVVRLHTGAEHNLIVKFSLALEEFLKNNGVS